MKPLSPKKAAQIIDFLAIDRFQILEKSARFLDKLADELEDINAHSEWTVLQAMRCGTEQDIEEAREILRGHMTAGELTPDLARRRHALNRKLSGITTETEAEKLIPQAVETIVVPRSLFEKMAVAMCGLSWVKTGWTMPEGGPETYGKIWKQSLPFLEPQ